MGLLDKFLGTKEPARIKVQNDQIWLNHAARIQGVKRDLRKRTNSNGGLVLVISHFADAHADAMRIVKTNDGFVPVKAIVASEIPADVAEGIPLNDRKFVDVLFFERHPLRGEDEGALKELMSMLPAKFRVTHHVALDDAIVDKYEGELIEKVTKTLGADENAPIDSELVRNRVRAAHDKLARSIAGNAAAVSARQWIEKNIAKSG